LQNGAHHAVAPQLNSRSRQVMSIIPCRMPPTSLSAVRATSRPLRAGKTAPAVLRSIRAAYNRPRNRRRYHNAAPAAWRAWSASYISVSARREICYRLEGLPPVYACQNATPLRRNMMYCTSRTKGKPKPHRHSQACGIRTNHRLQMASRKRLPAGVRSAMKGTALLCEGRIKVYSQVT